LSWFYVILIHSTFSFHNFTISQLDFFFLRPYYLSSLTIKFQQEEDGGGVAAGRYF